MGKKAKKQVEVVLEEEILMPEKVEEEPIEPQAFVNNEFCSACSGGGSLICCESCPKSFHFTCADPPIDPENIPDENWFCNECSAKARSPSPIEGAAASINTVTDLWDRLIERTDRMNPKAFTLPKRIRKMLNESEEDLSKKASKSTSKSVDRAALGEKKKNRNYNDNKQDQEQGSTSQHHHDEEYRQETVQFSARTRQRERITEEGYCHVCNKGSRNDKHLIRCDDCSILWHLDCLPYPLAVYPSSHRHWSCPIHITEENLTALNLSSDKLSQALKVGRMPVGISDWPEDSLHNDGKINYLPETSVRLQFGWDTATDHNEEHYTGCLVPPEVRSAYNDMRRLSESQLRVLKYYESFSYTDQSVEANLAF